MIASYLKGAAQNPLSQPNLGPRFHWQFNENKKEFFGQTMVDDGDGQREASLDSEKPHLKR